MNEDSIVYINSEFVPLNQAKVSIMDRGFLYGDGIFETLRSYGGKIFKLQEHLDRMCRSATALQLQLPLPPGELVGIANALLEKNNLQNAILRITLTRGVGEHGILIDDHPPTLVIFARPVGRLEIDDSGVAIVLAPDGASALPGIAPGVKSCNFLPQILLRETARRKGAFEAIGLSDKGFLTEGSVCNIFLVKDGVLKTPALNSLILPGITRQTVIEIADKEGIECLETSLTPESLYNANEIFIVNTGWEIIPVAEVDGRKINSEVPGPVSELIKSAYRKIVEALNDPC